MAKKQIAPTRTKRPSATKGGTAVRATGTSKASAIVGIGASAGGLEACTNLLRFLPADTGLTFVLVQHLDPGHASMLVQLLSRATSMKVSEARNGVVPEPNHIYVIPPDRQITILRGRLKLAMRAYEGAIHLPIDAFLCSLASDQGQRAIGVVLSGGGSDGTAGLEAIRAEGGLTLAQDEASAKQPGMPHSAIAAGCVDLILPLDGIAAELTRIARHPYTRAIVSEELPRNEQELFRQTVELLHASMGVDFSGYRPNTISRRIRRRMALNQSKTPQAYLERLQDDPAEMKALYEDILIHVTKFFRDEEVFEVINAQIIPALTADRKPGEPIRVWVPGCSTGEEVYSIAMLFIEGLGDGATANLQIFGTDLSETAIERARGGVYGESAVAGISSERLNRFFVRGGDGYRIRKRVRDVCVFAKHDLVKDPPFSRLDLISCRNVLIYMDPDLQKRIIEIFHYALRPQGKLILGKAESPGTRSSLFAQDDRKNRIYSQKPLPSHRRLGPARLGPVRPEASRAILGAILPFDLTKAVEHVFVTRYLPAAVLVDSDLQILQFHGDTGPYLKPAQGPATLHLLKMVREELAMDLRTLLHRAKKEDKQVSKAPVRLSKGDQIREITLDVIPIRGRRGKESDYLVVFLEPALASPAVPAAGNVKREPHLEAARLRQELSAAREFLQSAMEDAEVTNEELRAANEEVLSNNEELQSTIEELETAKEQMQSSNEELTTLNEELEVRNVELAHLNTDLNNVLTSVQVPVVLLGHDYRIRRLAPAAENLFNLRPGDVGRPLSDIQPNFDEPDLISLISTVMKTEVPLEREIKDRNGKWHSLHVHPYRSEERIDGTFLAAFDVDLMKKSLEAARTARDYAEAVVMATHEPLLVLDGNLKILTANSAFCSTFQIKAADVRGDLIFEAADGAWNIAALHGILSDVMRQGQPVEGIEITHVFPGIGEKTVLLNIRPVVTMGSIHLILLAVDDVTQRLSAVRELRDSEALFRAVFESTSRAILGMDAAGEIVLANGVTQSMFGYSAEQLAGLQVEQLMPIDVSKPPCYIEPKLDILGLRKDGTQFPIEVHLSSVYTRMGILSVAFVEDVSARKAAEKEMSETATALGQSREQLRRLTTGLMRAQEEERRHISRDLHDDLNQRLASLVMQLETLENTIPSGQENIRKPLETMRKHVERISDGVRRAAYQLHPSVLEHLGLVAALKSLSADFQSHGPLHVALNHKDVPRSIPTEAALCLYRVAQESLRNVLKHTDERSADMTLSYADGIIRLIVDDKGPGFSPKTAGGPAGLGIVSMEERVRLVGGTLAIQSQPGSGTRVEVSLPLEVTPHPDRRAE